MRAVVLSVSLLVASAAFASPSLELEVGAGAQGWERPAAPTLSGRVGLMVADWLTPGVRAIALQHGSWGILGDVRVHTAPRLFQLNAGLGFGFATAQTGSEGVTAQAINPYVIGDVGVRLNFWRMWLGLNVGATPIGPGWMSTLSIGIAPFGRD